MKKRKLKYGSRQTSKPKPEVTLPKPQWDQGAAGPANRIGLIREQATDVTPEGETPNPNEVTRWRRVGQLEEWHGNFVKGAKSATGQPLIWISTRQYNAATTLRDAWEATGRSPGWLDNDRVQSSAKPDQAITIRIDRVSRYHAVARHVIASDRDILDTHVLRELPIRGHGWKRYKDMEHLREALGRLADRLERR